MIKARAEQEAADGAAAEGKAMAEQADQAAAACLDKAVAFCVDEEVCKCTVCVYATRAEWCSSEQVGGGAHGCNRAYRHTDFNFQDHAEPELDVQGGTR